MAIKRFFANKNNTITNAFKADLSTRATGSNMGESDVLEVFHLYGQASGTNGGGTDELSRVLIDFPVTTDIAAARTAGTIPASGNVDFYLRMFDAPHTETTPTQITLTVAAISQSWTQGTGLDMTTYKNNGVSNWIKAASSTTWKEGTEGTEVEGGSFHTGSLAVTSSQYFARGTEDLTVSVTHQVEEWLKGNTGSYGFGVFLTSSQETDQESHYTKKFFASGSEFFFKRPIIEARWDDSIKDDSTNFYISSSRATATDNLNTIYFYNYVRGQLANLPSSTTAGPIWLSIYSGSSDNTQPSGSKLYLPVGGGVATKGDTNITGGQTTTTGIYSASFAYVSSSVTQFFPVWHYNSTTYYTGSAITPKSFDHGSVYPIKDYVVNVTNLKTVYSPKDAARFQLYVRPRDWNPTIYTVAKTKIENKIIEKAYWQLRRVVDDLIIIDYGNGTGNGAYTLMSYDASGSYFDLDMSMLEAGYSYELKFMFNVAGDDQVQNNSFKFRVENGN